MAHHFSQPHQLECSSDNILEAIQTTAKLHHTNANSSRSLDSKPPAPTLDKLHLAVINSTIFHWWGGVLTSLSTATSP